jgi:hypothetical protein
MVGHLKMANIQANIQATKKDIIKLGQGSWCFVLSGQKICSCVVATPDVVVFKVAFETRIARDF